MLFFDDENQNCKKELFTKLSISKNLTFKICVEILLTKCIGQANYSFFFKQRISNFIPVIFLKNGNSSATSKYAKIFVFLPDWTAMAAPILWPQTTIPSEHLDRRDHKLIRQIDQQSTLFFLLSWPTNFVDKRKFILSMIFLKE